MAEQRYRAVLAVISDGRTVKETAAAVGVSRQTLHAWLAKYEAGGLQLFGDGSHRPRGCPHQIPAVVEAAVLEARRAHPSWGPRRIAGADQSAARHRVGDRVVAVSLSAAGRPDRARRTPPPGQGLSA